MSVFRSIARFFSTLGGLFSSKVDEGTDSMVTTPSGVKAAFRKARQDWTRQYHDVRDAVSQLMMVMEQRRSEIKSLEKERDELETKKRGAVEKFRQTKEEKYQTLFQDYHTRLGEVVARLEELNRETADMEGQVERHKGRLVEMQKRIQDLDKQEAAAIADIVSSQQIIELNDRMSKLGTSLHDENLNAIERTRQKVRAKAKLSEELAGTDREELDREVMAAATSNDAMEEFNQLVAEAELRQKERPAQGGDERERTM